MSLPSGSMALTRPGPRAPVDDFHVHAERAQRAGRLLGLARLGRQVGLAVPPHRCVEVEFFGRVELLGELADAPRALR